MPRFILAALVAALVALTPTVRAVAGIADSPLPVLGSGPAVHLLDVPGVIRTIHQDTVFICTSTETAVTIRIGVELFLPAGGAPINNVRFSANVTESVDRLDYRPGNVRLFGAPRARDGRGGHVARA